MASRLRIGVGVAVLASIQVAAWLLYRGVNDQRSSTSRPLTFAYDSVSGLAPGLEVPLEFANGTTTRLKDYEDEPVVVHFWATWCAPCRTELPTLLALANDSIGNKRVRLLLISVDENWGTVRHFFDGNIPNVVLRDATGTAQRAFAVQALPESYVLRRGSKLSARIRGARDWSSAAARESLGKLLATH